MSGSPARPTFRQLFLGFLALTLSIAPAAAQERMAWHATETDEGGALVFGLPDSEAVTIFFLCTRGAEDIVVQPMIGSKGLKADDSARAILYAGKLKKVFAGKAIASEKDSDINVEAAGKMADLKALVKAGPTLTIETKGAKQKVVLQGAPEAFAQFEAACAPR